jgi:hypothetical protein
MAIEREIAVRKEFSVGLYRSAVGRDGFSTGVERPLEAPLPAMSGMGHWLFGVAVESDTCFMFIGAGAENVEGCFVDSI